jgi:microcystin-dependent protein
VSEQFLSEIRLFGFTFPPKGWAFCNGQTMAINQNQALFALLGTTYGGNGQTTFLLPNLQGRVPLHFGAGPVGNNYVLGQNGGEANHTLTLNEIPQHNHLVTGSAAPSSFSGPGVPAAVAGVYGPAANLTALDPSSLAAQGGGQPHPNLMPYLTLNFCIALVGIFPSRN